MVKLIVGSKGSGKTKRMVDELNQLAADGKNVVCIEPERRLDHSIKYTIRLIDISEYPVHSYSELLGFIAGLCAKDYDLDAIYVDSIYKLAESDDQEALGQFLEALDAFLGQLDKAPTCHVMVSADVSELGDRVLKYQI